MSHKILFLAGASRRDARTPRRGVPTMCAKNSVQLPRQFAQALLHFVNDLVRGGCAGGESRPFPRPAAIPRAGRPRPPPDAPGDRTGGKWPPVRACCCCARRQPQSPRPACRAISIAAACRCLVGWQTVSRKRISERGNRRRITPTKWRTRSIGWVVWAATPKRGRSASWSTSSSVSTTSNSARSPVNPRTSTWSRRPMMTG